MKEQESIEKLLFDLKERAKELNCLYKIQEILNNEEISIDEVCKKIVQAIPPGWQFPDICKAKMIFLNSTYKTEGFEETNWKQCADIKVQDELVGTLCVYYLEERPVADEGPFLKEERKLIKTIADEFGLYILNKRLKSVFEEYQSARKEQRSEWGIIIDMLKHTDPRLLIRISRKMVNYLCWTGVKKAETLLEQFSPIYKEGDELLKEVNSPYQIQAGEDLLTLSYKIFDIAGEYISENEVLNQIQKWIKEDQSGFLVDILENTGTSLSEISGAIERYHHLASQGLELSAPREMSFRVALIRRLLSDQPSFIQIAKNIIEVDDFNDLLHYIISPEGSHGKVGGKGSGLFLAKQILEKESKNNNLLSDIKTPKTWYITSDVIINFMSYNNLEDIIEQKYKEIGQVRQEYPYVVHVFKNSPFPPEIVKGLSIALEDFGETPLIIRSSSLLEDRLGASFAGKYKSLFIANQGTKEKRLAELLDAISEVYASTFAPDPIEYRSEHELHDFHEEMGILIQEVVGTKVGKYFFPAFAGVAFSHNEFRWSKRIRREDGLIRMVPGLGTRAVDRLSNDYPILIAPGQPNLRVNITIEEIIRYSPKYIDAINLETCTFETLEIQKLLKEYGREYPGVNKIISILTEDIIREPRITGTDFERDNFVVTFEKLLSDTHFVEQIKTVLDTLFEKYNHPIDIEFAHDGTNLYLLQCRSQSYSKISKPPIIPASIPEEKLFFSANRYISNGIISGITHIVYVNPQKYGELSSYDQLKAVGRAIGKLNKILPKRQFILMGPGRWGSRGDIKLGVSVTYSDINNTSMLIEIARRKKDYVPDLSFGTHFFQDLVEANIRYLPLYPDEKDNIFNEKFIENSKNIFPEIIPDFDYLSDVIQVIDLSDSANGQTLEIIMNAELDKAVAVLTEGSAENENSYEEVENNPHIVNGSGKHWRWRKRVVEGIAAALDPERFGVKGFYLFGSTKNATAGPASDIDIIIHFSGTESQRDELLTWLEGWSLSLSHINYLRTGKKTNGLLDVHLVTDEDIVKHTSYASKIGAITDAARPLAMGTALEKR